MEVTKREFIQHTSKYIKSGDFILTKHGVPEYFISIKDFVATKETKDEYGCGCSREVGKIMCDRHQRL